MKKHKQRNIFHFAGISSEEGLKENVNSIAVVSMAKGGWTQDLDVRSTDDCSCCNDVS